MLLSEKTTDFTLYMGEPLYLQKGEFGKGASTDPQGVHLRIPNPQRVYLRIPNLL